jgi:putative CocE/NonD family hydrolase
VHSINDGILDTNSPLAKGAADTFTVDYSIACKQPQPFLFWPCATDEHALTYTTAPLSANMQVTGHPVAHLWISSTAIDGDFFVNVEDVSPDGAVQVTNTGRLKASHRALNKPPYNYLGLPWHRSFQKDAVDLPRNADPVELAFALWPTSKLFKAGHRIRVTITGSDPRQRYREQFNPAPVVTVYRGADHRSYVTLPVFPSRALSAEGQ